jgi:Putative beta-barrel porin 2
MKYMLASAGLITLGTVGVQSAHAQFLANANVEKPWSVSGTLRGFYDDNYNTQPDGPNRVDSFGFEVRPSATLNLPLEQTTLSLSYIYDLKWYEARVSGKTDQSHDVEVFLNHNFSPRYSLDFQDSFVIAQEPEVIDRSLSVPTRTDGSNLRNNGTFNFHAEVTELLGLVLGYSNTFYDYAQNAGNQPPTDINPSRSALLDRVEHLVSLNSRWHIMPQTTAILGYQFGAIDYLSGQSIATTGVTTNTPTGPRFVRNATPVASDRNNYSHTLYVGGEHSLRSDFFITGQVGASFTDYYNDPATESVWNPYVNISGTYTYMEGGNLTLGFRHSRNATDVASFTTGGSLTQDQESSTLYGTISQKITPRLTGTLTGQYQNSTFLGGTVDGQTDTFYLLGVNLAYQFTRFLSAEVGYNYDQLDSDIALRGFTRNRVYLGVTASY